MLFLRNTAGLRGEPSTWFHLLARVLVLNEDQTMAVGEREGLQSSEVLTQEILPEQSGSVRKESQGA